MRRILSFVFYAVQIRGDHLSLNAATKITQKCKNELTPMKDRQVLLLTTAVFKKHGRCVLLLDITIPEASYHSY